MIHDLVRRENPFGNMFELVNLFEGGFPKLRTSQNHSLKTDLVETDKSYVATFDVPGIKRDDIDITFENQVLTISIKAEEEKEGEDRRYRVRERRYEQSSRSFHLPDADSEGIKADIANGVLTVTANKNKQSQAKKIAIKS